MEIECKVCGSENTKKLFEIKTKLLKEKNINLDAIFEVYKNELWADNFLTKNLIRLLNSMNTSHFEIICEK